MSKKPNKKPKKAKEKTVNLNFRVTPKFRDEIKAFCSKHTPPWEQTYLFTEALRQYINSH